MADFPTAMAVGDRWTADRANKLGQLAVIAHTELTTVNSPGANAIGSTTVTFPAGLFPAGSAVNVQLTPISAAPGVATPSVNGVSSTGCTVYCKRTDSGTSTLINLLAIATQT